MTIEAIGYARIVETDGVYTVPEETLPVECIAQQKVFDYRVTKHIREVARLARWRGRIDVLLWLVLPALAALAVTL